MSEEPLGHRLFIERLIIALVVVGIALLVWNLRGLFLLVFGSVLVAVILNLIAEPLRRRLKLPGWAGLLVAILVVAVLIGTAFWLFGSEVLRQAKALQSMLPAAWQTVLGQLESWGIAEPVRQWSASLGGDGGVVSRIGVIAMTVGNAVADALLVIVGGIYLASQPGLYWSGIIKLVPERARPLAADALEASGRALRLWLLGRLVSMAVVGMVTWIGLSIIGVPSALTLALLAALLEFIPFVGPIISAVPAVLLAFAAGTEAALWTVALFTGVQQFEGNVLEPLVQQRAVDLPPALLLFALVAGALIFGAAGIVLAAPLTVVIYVLVKRLYVQEALNTRTTLPGEDAA